MKKINLGRVMPVFRGEFDSEAIYTKLDIVSYDGSSYVARRTVTGTAPTDTENWLLVAQAGGVSWVDLTEQQKAEIYNTIISEIFGVSGDRLTLKHNGNTVTFYDGGNITTATHSLDTMQQAIETNASAIEGKADSSDVYTKDEIDTQRSTLQNAINTKAAANTVYTKQQINSTVDQINTAVEGKANASSVYTKDAVDTKVGNVASAVSTLSGNVYSKSQVNSIVGDINSAIETLGNNTYSKAYLDNALNGKANAEDIFPKIITIDTATASIAISSTQSQNITYYCTTPLTSLTLPAVPAIGCENTIFFRSGSTPTSLTYPSTLKWIGPFTVDIEANTTYALSILCNCAVMAPIMESTGTVN